MTPEYRCTQCGTYFMIGDSRAGEPCGNSAHHPIQQVVVLEPNAEFKQVKDWVKK